MRKRKLTYEEVERMSERWESVEEEGYEAQVDVARDIIPELLNYAFETLNKNWLEKTPPIDDRSIVSI